MSANGASGGLWEKPLDTLAQSGTGQKAQKPIIVYGNGSDLTDKERQARRAKRKTISQVLALNLIKVAEEKGDLDWLPTYWNTYYCHNEIQTAGDRAYGKYCKNRWCLLCSTNRKAELVNKYQPVLSRWKEPQLLTLTIVAIPVGDLKKWMDGVMVVLRKIQNRLRKRHKRGKGMKIMYVRSLECNFNPKNRTYNPHFHFITPDYPTATILRQEWLRTWKHKYAQKGGQDIRPIDDLEEGLIEVMKYATKVFTEEDPGQKKKGQPRKIYVAALHEINKAMKGMRIFGAFGFGVHEQGLSYEPKSMVMISYDELCFDGKNWERKKERHSENHKGFSVFNERSGLAELDTFTI